MTLRKPSKAPPAAPYRFEDARTPQDVLDRVRQLGPIDLDPCGARGSLVGARVEWRGGEFENGLDRSWRRYGLVYCFPPPRETARWIEKIACEAADGAEVIALLPARPNAQWSQSWLYPTVDALCYWRGRLRCVDEPARSASPRLIAYWGPRAEAFRAAFASAGAISLGADMHRPRRWTLDVPIRAPTGTWLFQQGATSVAVTRFMAEFAAALKCARDESGCPPAVERRHAVITRHARRHCAEESFAAGCAAIVELLIAARLLSPERGYTCEFAQAKTTPQEHTEIAIELCSDPRDDSPPRSP